ncbi:hypothetical protein [Actinomadura verrucosospora]|uniref:CYTH domain-containing protein n=1 Tax=Actinomadura verrucosospora TaxID=46165 RepID=A0A7D3VX05_ACTVE|nr:hypothetical protein [Actinomadura verrucosospora]QKG25460.1 hypothetical protein ACTIVE_7112 [Actinomadura verrucosospora]
MPIEIERKFLLGETPDWSHPVLAGADVIEYEQVYLRVAGGEQVRIRRGVRDGRADHRLARLRRLSDGVREVEESELDAAEYARLRADRDPRREIVAKVRRCFRWDGLLFELDDIRRPAARACHLLELQVASLEEPYTLPGFLVIDREVTTEPAFSNAAIALG